MVSVSGVRGVFGETITPEIVAKFSAHFGVIRNRGKIAVGRDSRTTGETMFYAVISGLMSVGCEVIDLGLVSTPTILLAVEQDETISGGICITASHNPEQWNAMKFVSGNGMFLSPEEADSFIKSLDTKIEYANWQNIGKRSYALTSIDRHIYKIVNIPYIDENSIQKRKFKVVIDSVNGAGGLISPLLLRTFGCEVIEINSEPTGYFAHSPEPLNKNLKQLEEAVKKHNADIGFATDPDVDRLAIVNEKGQAIGEEFSLLLCEKYILSKRKGDIVTNLSSSMASEDIANEFGVKVHRTKVGEINVGIKMKQLLSPIGGEGNGGIICPDVHYTRDAPAGMALILAYMEESKKSVSELVAEIPHYYFAKDKIIVAPESLDQIMINADKLAENKNIDRTDGIKIIEKSHWIHIRKSGTEPIVRVYVEAKSVEIANQICKDTIQTLTKI